MFETILLAVDGSAHSERASAVATDLAVRYGSRLVINHVARPGRVPEQLAHMAEVEHLVDGVPASGRQHDERMRIAIGERLTGEVERAAHQAGVVSVSTEVGEGDPVKEILASIERNGAGAVVLGSRGLSDIGGLLLGSVSHKVCQLAPCTCVTVK